ncbi:MAG: restriction endonuclease subunit S [Candidatus Micrarchaeia archaeon]|jgi:type I restriction enzyme S subunit
MIQKFKETEIGKIPEDWEVKRIGDFVDIKHGYAFKGEYFSDEPTENILLTPGNFNIGGGFKDDKLKYTNEEPSSEYVLKKNEIIVTMTDLSKEGDTLGFSAKVPASKDKKYLHNQRIGLLKFKSKEVSADFIYWTLRTEKYHSSIVGSATGSTVKHTSPDRIKQYGFCFPRNLSEQTIITKILSSLDEKIELNRRTNKKLEEMVQALFKYWFVDFEFPDKNGKPYKSSGGAMVDSELGKIPKGWEIKNIDELTSKFTTGLNPRNNFKLGNGNNFYVTIKNIGNQNIILDERCDKVDDNALLKINARSKLEKGDILFSGIGTIGKTFFVDETPSNWNVSESIFTLRANTRLISTEILYYLLLSSNFQDYAHQLASGSVQKGIRMRDLKRYRLAVPPMTVQNETSAVFSSVLQKLIDNHNVMRSLSSIRDSLLPKLMSGKIRVSV